MTLADSPLRRLGLGCAAVALLTGLALLAPLPYLLPKSARVAAAVRRSYPELCHEWRDTLAVSPSWLGWFSAWDVTCVAGVNGDRYPVLAVNVVTCRARAPLAWTRDWQALLMALAGDGAPMAVCP